MGAALASFIVLRIPVCPFASFTGHPCPGCGLTRATLALAQGHLHEAIAFHPLAPLISPLAVGFLGYGAFVYVRSGRWPALAGPGSAWLVAAGLMGLLLVAVWIARFYGAFGGPVPV